MDSKILLINRYLVSFLPVTLIFSIFLADLIVVCASIIFLFFIFKNKKLNLFDNPEFKIFLILYSSVLISLILSDLKPENFIKGIAYLRFGILILIIKYLIDYDKNFLNLFVRITIYSIIILFFGVLLQVFDFEPLSELKPYSRFTSFFHDESVLGSYLIKISPLLIGILIYLEKKKLKI